MDRFSARPLNSRTAGRGAASAITCQVATDVATPRTPRARTGARCRMPRHMFMPNDTLMGLGSYVASTTGFSESVLLLATHKNNVLRSRDGVTPLGYVVFLIVECLVSSPLSKAVLAERVKSAAMTDTFSTGSAATRFLAVVALILFCAPHPSPPADLAYRSR